MSQAKWRANGQTSTKMVCFSLLRHMTSHKNNCKTFYKKIALATSSMSLFTVLALLIYGLSYIVAFSPQIPGSTARVGSCLTIVVATIAAGIYKTLLGKWEYPPSALKVCIFLTFTPFAPMVIKNSFASLTRFCCILLSALIAIT